VRREVDNLLVLYFMLFEFTHLLLSCGLGVVVLEVNIPAIFINLVGEG
jgi:hypothetical protein